MKQTFYCAHCKGVRGTENGHVPFGWYQVTVSVPEHMQNTPGRGYLWVGTYCSSDCLAAAMPDIARQEMLARMAYEAEMPLS